MGGYPLRTLFVNSVPVVALSRDERWFDEREMKSKKKKRENSIQSSVFVVSFIATEMDD